MMIFVYSSRKSLRDKSIYNIGKDFDAEFLNSKFFVLFEKNYPSNITYLGLYIYKINMRKNYSKNNVQHCHGY